VSLIIEAQQRLAAEGIRARVVSAPSLEIFAQQPEDYQRSVLPVGPPRVAVEAAHPLSWYRWVGTGGAILGLERFGASAPGARVMKELGFTADHVVEMARSVVKG
jgi:transketolase